MCEKNIIPDYIARRALAVLDFWQVSWIFSDFFVRCPDFSVGGVGRYANMPKVFVAMCAKCP